MSEPPTLSADQKGRTAAIGLLMICATNALGGDWPQYRGPTTDGISPELIATNWPATGPTVFWANMSVTNGFSSFAVSQGRAFAMMSKDDGSGILQEYCVAVDAATGTNIWAAPIDVEPWDPGVNANGGAGAFPYDTGDGPRTTPSVKDDRVIALSGLLHLVCLNVTNGAVTWSNDLVSSYGASRIGWDNAASPCLDNDLVFVNLNTALDSQTLAAFRTSDGGLAWSSQNEGVTHTTPIVARIQGVRQVIFATQTGLVSLDRTTGNFLWKFTYPFFPIAVSMGASPVVYSNIVFCTASYGRGATAAQVTLNNGAWAVQQLYYKTGLDYRSIWMTPVCFQGYIYTLCGDNTTFLTTPLNCIELATGNLQWSTNNFGMGGLILVGTNLLVLTEDGQLVVVQPAPDAYHELARYQAFNFSPSARGKCWNSPAFSNGRIYARSTIGGICVDASVPVSSALKLLSPQFLNRTQLQLVVGTANGTPIDPTRLSKISVRASSALGTAGTTWSNLTNPLALDANGQARVTITIGPGQTRQFYSTVEQP
jgi:hypothetical protein